uniref:Uncharacterized protein n=1 Tax=Seriola dumerili TaxID=41447 RepID=A0A3B4V6X4_SERDU
MNLGRLLRRQRDPNPILRIPLPPPLRHCGILYPPCPLPPRNRLKQPHRVELRYRQNFIPPLLLVQRPARLCNTTGCTYLLSIILPQPPRGPGAPTLHPRSDGGSNPSHLQTTKLYIPTNHTIPILTPPHAPHLKKLFTPDVSPRHLTPRTAHRIRWAAPSAVTLELCLN